MKRDHTLEFSTPRLYGGLALGWTWPAAAMLAHLRVGWYKWPAVIGTILVVGIVSVGMIDPTLTSSVAVETTITTLIIVPFLYLFLVFITAPIAARWRWAEQQLVLNWAKQHAGIVVRRTEYWDFASSEWVGAGIVSTDAPILARGHAIGYPTLLTVGRATVGRAVLGFRSATARVGRSRGSRDVILFAYIPIGLPETFAVEKICCCRRSPTTVAQIRILERLYNESFESIEWDNRVWVGIGKGDDPVATRQIIDPVTIDHFATSDTVWEITRRGVTAYRRRRASNSNDIEQLFVDVNFLANKLEFVSRLQPSKQISDNR